MWIFRFSKTPSITEKTDLQFRAEFFNILNRSNFGPPNTTVFSGDADQPIRRA